MLHAEELLEKGAEAFLAAITIVRDEEEKELCDIAVVVEYEDAFGPLQGPPPKRDFAFTIELEPGTIPVSRAPYRLAPSEMTELKKTARGFD